MEILIFNVLIFALLIIAPFCGLCFLALTALLKPKTANYYWRYYFPFSVLTYSLILLPSIAYVIDGSAVPWGRWLLQNYLAGNLEFYEWYQVFNIICWKILMIIISCFSTLIVWKKFNS